MTALQIIQLLNMINTGMKVAQSAGVNLDSFNKVAKRARAEGRDITPEELDALANEAQDAINRI